MTTQRIVSGIRPTGPLHIGHYLGVLKNWVSLQDEYESMFFVADWHAMTSEYRNTGIIEDNARNLVITWLGVGLDPEKAVMFRQSHIKSHAELFLLMSMITPLPWLERNPIYKDMREQLREKDLNTFGFLGYPVLMASDIVIYDATHVPIGEDQLPHLELTREMVRRFNFIAGEDVLLEPKELLTKAAKVPGLDGRKMSKSYQNAIFIKETPESLKTKVMQMLTDPKRMRRADPGEPRECNLYPFHEYFTDEDTRAEIQVGCRNASLGCVDCKRKLLKSLEAEFAPIWERIAYYEQHDRRVDEILEQGRLQATERSEVTMHRVREALHLP